MSIKMDFASTIDFNMKLKFISSEFKYNFYTFLQEVNINELYSSHFLFFLQSKTYIILLFNKGVIQRDNVSKVQRKDQEIAVLVNV
jgi:hypothetical protein